LAGFLPVALTLKEKAGPFLGKDFVPKVLMIETSFLVVSTEH